MKEITNLLAQLAAKLGTTAEYLWKVLIHQAAISATVSLIFVIGIIIAGIILFKIHMKLSKKDEDGNDAYDNDISEGGTAAIMVILCIVWVILFFIIILVDIPNAITGYFNPEYWALQKVLDTIKN